MKIKQDVRSVYIIWNEELKSRIETKANWKDIEFDGGSITVEDDRVKIMHDEKPEPEIINELKRNGFRWSRYWGCCAESIQLRQSMQLKEFV
jgi:hypothetical protein